MTPIFGVSQNGHNVDGLPLQLSDDSPHLQCALCLLPREVTHIYSGVALGANRPECGQPKSTPDWEEKKIKGLVVVVVEGLLCVVRMHPNG